MDSAIAHLNKIFRARNDNALAQDLTPNTIGPRRIRTDGYANGGHGTIIFCIKCYNGLSAIGREPTIELTSYIGTSYLDGMRLNDYGHLFAGWRAPALGMILIGEHLSHPPRMYYLIQCLCSFVQFCGIALLEALRIEPSALAPPVAEPQGSRFMQ
jgi:hypothetical protein